MARQKYEMLICELAVGLYTCTCVSLHKSKDCADVRTRSAYGARSLSKGETHRQMDKWEVERRYCTVHPQPPSFPTAGAERSDPPPPPDSLAACGCGRCGVSGFVPPATAAGGAASSALEGATATAPPVAGAAVGADSSACCGCGVAAAAVVCGCGAAAPAAPSSTQRMWVHRR